MLKGISHIIPPILLKILCEMGHGDEIVIADGNFPAQSMSNNLVRCDGNTVPDILHAILPLFPLETSVEYSAMLMDIEEKDRGTFVPIRWKEYKNILHEYDANFSEFEKIERFSFYDRAKNAYAIIASGDKEIYANIILKKGVINSL